IQNDYYLNQRKLDIDELKASNDNKNERIRARDARILQLVGFGVTLGTFAIGWGLRSKWLAKGFKFEETGTFSSKTMMECFKEVSTSYVMMTSHSLSLFSLFAKFTSCIIVEIHFE